MIRFAVAFTHVSALQLPRKINALLIPRVLPREFLFLFELARLCGIQERRAFLGPAFSYLATQNDQNITARPA